jgi:hypothetical protein
VGIVCLLLMGTLPAAAVTVDGVVGTAEWVDYPPTALFASREESLCGVTSANLRCEIRPADRTAIFAVVAAADNVSEESAFGLLLKAEGKEIARWQNNGGTAGEEALYHTEGAAALRGAAGFSLELALGCKTEAAFAALQKLALQLIDADGEPSRELTYPILVSGPEGTTARETTTKATTVKETTTKATTVKVTTAKVTTVKVTTTKATTVRATTKAAVTVKPTAAPSAATLPPLTSAPASAVSAAPAISARPAPTQASAAAVHTAVPNNNDPLPEATEPADPAGYPVWGEWLWTEPASSAPEVVSLQIPGGGSAQSGAALGAGRRTLLLAAAVLLLLLAGGLTFLYFRKPRKESPAENAPA